MVKNELRDDAIEAAEKLAQQQRLHLRKKEEQRSGRRRNSNEGERNRESSLQKSASQRRN